LLYAAMAAGGLFLKCCWFGRVDALMQARIVGLLRR
jgi:hypothetical protein